MLSLSENLFTQIDIVKRNVYISYGIGVYWCSLNIYFKSLIVLFFISSAVLFISNSLQF